MNILQKGGNIRVESPFELELRFENYFQVNNFIKWQMKLQVSGFLYNKLHNCAQCIKKYPKLHNTVIKPKFSITALSKPIRYKIQ